LQFHAQAQQLYGEYIALLRRMDLGRLREAKQIALLASKQTPVKN
jgi:hypothetical protein